MEESFSQKKERCVKLRKEDHTLGEIIEITGYPKSTVLGYIQDTPLSDRKMKAIRRASSQRITALNKKRKGKSLLGRDFLEPREWSDDLIFVITHLIFDGRVARTEVSYYNRSENLVSQVGEKMGVLFDIEPLYKLRPHDIRMVAYYNVEFSSYVIGMVDDLFSSVVGFGKEKKRIFLKAFFDDEGCVSFYQKKSGTGRKVRGYQKDSEILILVQDLLNDFEIESRIPQDCGEIAISRKKSLEAFQKEINFSKGVCINPDRKNSVWKEKLEKREILARAIDSYEI